MKLLDRYVLRELVVPFLIGTVAVVLMFDANLLMAIQKSLNLSSVPVAAIAQYILFKTPSFLNMTLPVGMSLAASLAMSRLARESELTAMRSAGASVLRVLAPIVFFGCLVAIGNFLIVEKVMPQSEQRADSIERQIGVLVATPTFTQNAYVKLQKFQAHIGSVTKIGEDNLELSQVLLFSVTGQNGQTLIYSPLGTYDHGAWKLKGATIYEIQGDTLTQIRSNQDFPINERIAISDLFVPPAPEQLSLGALHQEIVDAHKEGRSAQTLEVQYQTRFSVPASCILFAFVAPCLAIVFGRTGGFAGVLLSIFLCFLYYNAFVVTTDILGKNPSMPPWLAAWLPNILFVVMGLFAVRRIE